MTIDEVIKKIEENLGSMVELVFRRNDKRAYVDVPPEYSLQANRYMIEDIQGRLATATGKDTPDRIEVLYHYCFDSSGLVVTIRTWAEKPDCELDSVATILPGANFIEREINDVLGIRFLNHPDPRRLILADDWPEGVYPLRRDFSTRRERKETPEFLREMTKEATTP